MSSAAGPDNRTAPPTRRQLTRPQINFMAYLSGRPLKLELCMKLWMLRDRLATAMRQQMRRRCGCANACHAAACGHRFSDDNHGDAERHFERCEQLQAGVRNLKACVVAIRAVAAENVDEETLLQRLQVCGVRFGDLPQRVDVSLPATPRRIIPDRPTPATPTCCARA